MACCPAKTVSRSSSFLSFKHTSPLLITKDQYNSQERFVISMTMLPYLYCFLWGENIPFFPMHWSSGIKLVNLPHLSSPSSHTRNTVLLWEPQDADAIMQIIGIWCAAVGRRWEGLHHLHSDQQGPAAPLQPLLSHVFLWLQTQFIQPLLYQHSWSDVIWELLVTNTELSGVTTYYRQYFTGPYWANNVSRNTKKEQTLFLCFLLHLQLYLSFNF